ncbi:unnamed protein product, partial [Callosobruchus maculatus]
NKLLTEDVNRIIHDKFPLVETYYNLCNLVESVNDIYGTQLASLLLSFIILLIVLVNDYVNGYFGANIGDFLYSTMIILSIVVRIELFTRFGERSSKEIKNTLDACRKAYFKLSGDKTARAGTAREKLSVILDSMVSRNIQFNVVGSIPLDNTFKYNLFVTFLTNLV